ncbi:MAG: putative arp2 3 complex 21 kd subunit, partial [Streblomastix strix]
QQLDFLVDIVGNEETDIVDEAIKYFRANVLFKNFELNGPADKMLAYLTLFITQCLQKVERAQTKAEGTRVLGQYILQNQEFADVGTLKFCLGGLVTQPTNVNEKDTLNMYMKQIREETVVRLLEKIYDKGTLNKWWLAFSKRKFLNKVFS